MHLKKCLCMLVIVTVANVAFAGTMFSRYSVPPTVPSKTIKTLATAPVPPGKYPERTQLEYLINNTFLVYELLPLLQPVPEEMESAVSTAAALRAGLLAYEADVRSNRELSGNSKTIDTMLREVPTVLNKIQNTSDEIAEELIPKLEQLATYIVDNQNKVDPNEVDLQVAAYFLFSFTYQKAEADGELTGRVSRILMQEMQNALEMLQQ